MGSCSSPTVRGVAGLGLVALVWALSACGVAPAASTTIHAERHTWGGMCAPGPCASDLVVEDDGTWTYATEEYDTHGTLSWLELNALHAAVAHTAVGGPSAAADDCEADWDGESERFAWTRDGDSGAASSCEVVIDWADPLVRYLEDLAESVD